MFKGNDNMLKPVENVYNSYMYYACIVEKPKT